jgi:hypothetical protein
VQNLGASDARERIPGMSSAKIPLLAPLVTIKKNTKKKRDSFLFTNEVVCDLPESETSLLTKTEDILLAKEGHLPSFLFRMI